MCKGSKRTGFFYRVFAVIVFFFFFFLLVFYGFALRAGTLLLHSTFAIAFARFVVFFSARCVLCLVRVNNFFLADATETGAFVRVLRRSASRETD